MIDIRQYRKMRTHSLADIPEPPMAWLPPWQCSHCGELYGQGRDRTFRIPKGFEPLKFLMEWEHAHHWCHFSGNCHYVYAICYPSGLPFYVGKGSALRMVTHGKFVGKREPADEKELVLSELQSLGVSERYAILVSDVTAQSAYQIEAIAITQWGRRANGGLLTNRDEGQLVSEPECWSLPQPEQVPIKGNPYPTLWALHPKIQFRAPRVRGVALDCPRCTARFYTAPNEQLHALRCPACYHFIDVNNSEIYEYWRLNRHNHQVELTYPPPATCELPVRKLQPINSLSDKGMAVEDAKQELAPAVALEPQLIAQHESHPQAFAILLVGVTFGLLVSLLVAILVGAQNA